MAARELLVKVRLCEHMRVLELFLYWPVSRCASGTEIINSDLPGWEATGRHSWAGDWCGRGDGQGVEGLRQHYGAGKDPQTTRASPTQILHKETN